MHKLLLFKKDNCQFCEQLSIPEDLNVKVISISDPNYEGAIPPSIPLLEVRDGSQEPMALNNAGFINKFLETLKRAKDGIYNK